jgi:hypothetical protein
MGSDSKSVTQPIETDTSFQMVALVPGRISSLLLAKKLPVCQIQLTAISVTNNHALSQI